MQHKGYNINTVMHYPGEGRRWHVGLRLVGLLATSTPAGCQQPLQQTCVMAGLQASKQRLLNTIKPAPSKTPNDISTTTIDYTSSLLYCDVPQPVPLE
jgi:hypothetical protein